MIFKVKGENGPISRVVVGGVEVLKFDVDSGWSITMAEVPDDEELGSVSYIRLTLEKKVEQ